MMGCSELTKSFRAGGTFVVLLVALNPAFFVIYRMAVFNTMPRDDYARFLLWLMGNPSGALPISPYCYRIGSMIAAAPFYKLLPPLHFTNLPPLPESYLRATMALSALTYVAAILCAMLTAHFACMQARLNRVGGILAGVVMFALLWFTQILAIDTLACAVVVNKHRNGTPDKF
jgi:hypothetical protein